jgi:hypothetical protein
MLPFKGWQPAAVSLALTLLNPAVEARAQEPAAPEGRPGVTRPAEEGRPGVTRPAESEAGHTHETPRPGAGSAAPT